MGIYDRDYYRQSLPRAGFGHFVAWSVTTTLIVLNVLVFFADAAVQRSQQPPPGMNQDDEAYVPPPTPTDGQTLLQRWGSFSIDKAILHRQIWRIITYQFLHAGIWHLVVNMLGLYFFGPIVEAHFGSRRFLAFYLLCGLIGAVTFTLMAFTGILHTSAATTLVGASAGIFGLLVAAAMIAPDVQIVYYFFPITIRIAAIGAMLLAVYSVIGSGTPLSQNAGGEAAHLGGGVMGFLFMKNQHWLNPFSPMRPVRRPVARRKRAMQKDWSKDFNR